MGGLTPATTSAVLVGVETADDAGVVRVSADDALVSTTDFITPPFDVPELYGAIAATNALSDVYAMGGEVLAALNLCLFPDGLPEAWAREVIAGANGVLVRAKAALIGGHTVRSSELFFGLAVTGRVHPARIWRNRGLKAGDAVILTKPLGTGIAVSAARKGQLPESVFAAVTTSMTTLNKTAAEVLRTFEVSACTDVTGFGLAGHGVGMARASGVTLELAATALPVFEGVLELQAQGVTCRGEHDNREALTAEVAVESRAPQAAMIFDPQTSGGLLVGLPASQVGEALRALKGAGVEAWQVGEARAKGSTLLRVSSL